MRIGFERQHVLLDEGADADAQAFDLGRQREVHDMITSLSTVMAGLVPAIQAAQPSSRKPA